MGIGARLKEAREAKGLTQKELGTLVGVTGSAITNYEVETSHPKGQILYKLINVLEIDANYLFQDCVTNVTTLSISLTEQLHIKKYRALDEHGKKTVDFILDSEYERCNPKLEPEKSSGLIKFSDSYIPRELDGLAAHAIPGASQEDIEDDIKRVMEDAAKDRLHRKE